MPSPARAATHAVDTAVGPPPLVAVPEAPRPRPVSAPPAALVPPPADPLEQERRMDAALMALDQVRAQLERTRRSLDHFIAQFTHIPAPEPTAAPAIRPPGPAEPALPPAPLDAATGTPDALAGFVLGPAAGGSPLAARVAGRRVAPHAEAAAGPHEPVAPVATPARRRGRPVGPRRATTPPEAGQVLLPVALADHLSPPGPSA